MLAFFELAKAQISSMNVANPLESCLFEVTRLVSLADDKEKQSQACLMDGFRRASALSRSQQLLEKLSLARRMWKAMFFKML